MRFQKLEVPVLVAALQTCTAACGGDSAPDGVGAPLAPAPSGSSADTASESPMPLATPPATQGGAPTEPANEPAPPVVPAPAQGESPAPTPTAPPDNPPACDASSTECGGACVDTSVDVQHCGGCDQACPPDSSCVDGACSCAGGLNDCSGVCVDLGSDGQHCGACNNACDEAAPCVQGECVAEGCMPGMTQCDEGCVDTNTDSDHCGGCDNACAQGQSCTDGSCQDAAPSEPSESDPASEYPCDGSTDGYDAVVTISGGNARGVIQDALNGLTANRTTKESVLVQGDGSIGSNERIEIPSYTVLNVCGTITVTSGNGSGDQAPFYARSRTDIEIPNATIRGVPQYGMFFREVSNLHLGRIDMRLDGQGLGIRIDNNPGSSNNWGRSNQVTNIRLDDIHVEGTGGHGVETYGVDGLTIGTVVARSTGDCGVLLNATINAEVGLVDAEDAATGTGYAGFRIANEAGMIGGSWPAGNIHVGEVRAIGGGRGIFCVSDSGGLTIDHLTLENNGNNSMLLENCHNVRLAAVSGTISGGGEVRISQRSDEHTPTSNISLGNLVVTGTQINESPCASNTVICNVEGSVNACGEQLAQCPW